MAMMLYYTERSPFARKVRMVLLHHGLMDEVKLVFAMPQDRSPELMAANPLGKIPALVREDGRSVVDSPVICQYLDGIGHGPLLTPTGFEERISVLHLEALADGILESAVLMVLESWRPEEFRWPGQFDKQTDNIRRTLAVLEAQMDDFSGDLTLAHLALGCALDYLYHRLPAIGVRHKWLARHPKLKAWHQQFARHPLMVNTVPKEGW